MRETDTKSHIRSVAVELFGIHGYELTSLREIADRVGITKASLYYHYPSKQALLLSIVEPLLTDYRAMVASVERLPHTPTNVRMVLERFLDMTLRHRPVCALLVRGDTLAVIADLAPIFKDVMGHHTRLHTWLAGPDPSAGDRLRAMAAVEVLGVALGSTKVMPDVPEDELRAALLDAAGGALRLRRRAVSSGRDADRRGGSASG